MSPQGPGRGPGVGTALLLALLLSACGHLDRIAAPAAPASLPAETTGDAAGRLHRLFDTTWQARLARYPEFATTLGDHRHGDRLTDASPEAEAVDYADKRRWLAQALAIDPAGLSAVDRVSREVFIHELQDELRLEPMVGLRRMTLAAEGGFQSELAELLLASPVRTAAQVEQMLARLAAWPRRVDQEIARLRQGLALGWVPARPVLRRVLDSLDAQLAADGDASPYAQPFTQLGEDIPAAEQQALRARAQRVIKEAVLPAQRRLRQVVAELLPAAPAEGGLHRYPGGAEAYAALVAQQTTTTLDPAEIHALGLREVARLQGEIATVMAELGWRGDFAAFAQHMNTDPRYLEPGPEALLASYRAIATRIDEALPRLFDRRPRAAFGVRAMPGFSGPQRSEYYDIPPLDGSGPGWFNVNTQAWRSRPRWGQETLTAHELVPGHHLQTAWAMELGELPAFRRSAWYVAYGEGWALYAETLGPQLGLYRDPASRYGHLQGQIFRAARLVVDTGLHAFGWSRQAAIDYLADTTGDDRGTVEGEVDRYLSWPGQALGYMVGKLRFDALRERARATLGPCFDIRRFHAAVLDHGAVPLDVLDRLVDAWIAVEAEAASRGRICHSAAP